MKRPVIAVLTALLLATQAFPWGKEGHQTVADIAQSLLNDQAKAAITQILGDETLADAAEWADAIKAPQGSLCQTPEAKAFNHAHGDNKKWHYVNFPVGSKKYTATSRFAYPHDVVQIINGCVTVLEGGEFENLTQKDALRLLLHFVGDVHQPLHVIAGYYDISDPQHPTLETNFAQINEDTPSDSGGNKLDYGPGEMHALWDTTLVNDIYTTSDPAVLAAKVMEGASPASYQTKGKPQTWAAKWATDSMKQAISAYADVQFGAGTYDPHGNLKKIDVTLQPSAQEYRQKYVVVAKEQLRKAGVHLAQLLNAINWDIDQ
jgi:hypothetical protein